MTPEEQEFAAFFKAEIARIVRAVALRQARKTEAGILAALARGDCEYWEYFEDGRQQVFFLHGAPWRFARELPVERKLR